MASMSLHSDVLPVLRPDVEFHPGPDASDGSPTYVIHDPLSGIFEKATWVQGEILQQLRVPLTVDRLLRRLAKQTTIKVTGEDVVRLCDDATRRGLTMQSRIADLQEWEQRQKSSRRRGITGWFRKGVFVRIPLIRPDAFLGRTVDRVSALASPAALSLYVFISLVGIYFLAQRFDAYKSTFPYFFNASGVAVFMLVIVAVKTIHEFSHAYVAKALGNRVPTMGVALIFLFPVAYADVTDSWRMRSRKKRLLISLAGVTAELILAGLALFLWAMSPPGAVKSICFVISSVTLISTLLINLNPAMRFDGYYVLSDLLGIDNLQSRAFEATRWAFRRHVLGMNVASPEVNLSPRRMAIMVAYALGAWAYRLALYAGIALTLYHRFTKVIGALLCFALVYSFILRPVVTEMISLLKMRRLLSWNRRTIVTTAVCGTVFLWAALPLPRWRTAPATTIAAESQIIYAPGNGVIRDLAVGLGSTVRKEQRLFVLESQELEKRAELARLNMERIGIELSLIKSNEKQRALLQPKLEEMARATAKLESIRTALAGNQFVAKVDGIVVDWDQGVRDGTPIGAQVVLGKIVDPRTPRLLCYVPHDFILSIAVGDSVYFCSDAEPGRLWGSVTFINPVRTEILKNSGLSSVAGGGIAVIPDQHGRLKVVDTYYEVEVALDDPPDSLRVGQLGTVWLRAAARSRLLEWFRYGYGLLVRESSF